MFERRASTFRSRRHLSHRGLLLRHIGYFASLQGCAKVAGDRTSVRVFVSTANVLTVARLQALVEEAR